MAWRIRAEDTTTFLRCEHGALGNVDPRLDCEVIRRQASGAHEAREHVGTVAAQGDGDVAVDRSIVVSVDRAVDGHRLHDAQAIERSAHGDQGRHAE
jgi:hypothetical protein